jgi:hypothetical protein
MESKVYSVRYGGTGIIADTTSNDGKLCVETLELETSKYDLVLTERSDVSYTDVPISLEDLEGLSEGLISLIKKIKEDAGKEEGELGLTE